MIEWSLLHVCPAHEIGNYNYWVPRNKPLSAHSPRLGWKTHVRVMLTVKPPSVTVAAKIPRPYTRVGFTTNIFPASIHARCSGEDFVRISDRVLINWHSDEKQYTSVLRLVCTTITRVLWRSFDFFFLLANRLPNIHTCRHRRHCDVLLTVVQFGTTLIRH